MIPKYYSIYEMIVTDEWKYHRGFLNMVESYLSELIEDWTKDIDRQALKIEDAAVREEFYAYHGEDYDELKKYRLILMNSFFTTSFALFQSELEMMCNFAKERTGTPFSVEDFGSRDYTNNAKATSRS